MNEQPGDGVAATAPVPPRYVHRGNDALGARLEARTASDWASFLLPYLRPGMRLLDGGCGPGAITLGLAEVLAPGEVVGVDLQPQVVAQARTLAAERGVTNVHFEVADLSHLPFPVASVDAVFCNAVLQYLQEPVAAVREFRRVLRPGGVAGIAAMDSGSVIHGPATPLLEELQALSRRALVHHGGNPFIGRDLRRLLVEAGFDRASATATLEHFGTSDETRRYVAALRAFFTGSSRTAVEQGWADETTVAAILAELQAWGERPDAFAARSRCEAIGWVDA